MKICFITAECVGPFRNGGIGTSTTGLAEALAAAGHEVTLFYTRGIHLTRRQIKYWQNIYRGAAINFIALRYSDLARHVGPLAVIGYTVPCAVLDFLSGNEFDVVHFNDTDAEGFLALAAHRYSGLLPAAGFVLGLHSPREWVYRQNRLTALVPVDATMHYTERLSAILADQIWSPSRYLQEWLAAAGWALPDGTVCQQYVMPSRDFLQAKHRTAASVAEEEKATRKLVFFGRLEERKGLRLFLDAVDRLRPELEQRQIGVAFLGRTVKMDGISSRDFIARRAVNWGFPWQVISTYGQAEALDFLIRARCLAVIASAADNSPCTVYEVIEAGIPFIAAARGGIPELIHEQDQAETLFEYELDSLTALILHRLDTVYRRIRPRISREQNIAGWLARHEELYSQRQSVAGTDAGFDVSVPSFIAVVEDHAGADALEETIRGLVSSDPPPVGVVVLSARGSDAGRFPPEVIFTGSADFEEHLAGLLGESREAVVFFMYSGTRVSANTLQKLSSCMQAHNVDGLMPSTARAGRYRTDAPGADIASVFVHGPVCTGMTAIDGRTIQGAMKLKGDGNAGPFQSLPDRAVIGGARIHPFPVATPDILVDSVPRVAMTVQRIEMYAHAGLDDIKMLITLAAVLSGEGPKNTLLRYWGYRLLRSGFGFLFAPVSVLKNLFAK